MLSVCQLVCVHGSESCKLTHSKHPSAHRSALPPSNQGVPERSAEKELQQHAWEAAAAAEEAHCAAMPLSKGTKVK